MKQLIRLLICISLLILVLGSRPLAFKSASQTTGLGYTGYMATVTNENTVSQTFVSSENNISGISVVAGVLNDELNGRLHLEVTEMLRKGKEQVVEGKRLVSVSKDAKDLSSHGQIYFWFPSVSIRSGALLKVSLSGDIKDNKGVTLWKSKKDIYTEGSIFDSTIKNSSEKKGDLVFSVFSKKSWKGIASSVSPKALLPISFILLFLLGSTILAISVVYQFSKVFKK